MRSADGLDSKDRELLQCVQDAFPLDPRPFRILGQHLGLPEREVMERLDRMYRRGVLKHIAPVLEMRETGVAASTLVAMKIAEERIEEVARAVNEYEEVSHNYRRDHPYNLWFTVAASSETHLRESLAAIRRQTGVQEVDILELPMTQRFKIDVRFRFVQENGGEKPDGRGRP